MNFLPFSIDEYAKRLKKTREKMSAEGLDALILTRAQNIYWLSGYRAAVMNWTLPLLPLVIPQKGEMRFMTRIIESSALQTHDTIRIMKTLTRCWQISLRNVAYRPVPSASRRHL